jgi:hypothetical protein
VVTEILELVPRVQALASARREEDLAPAAGLADARRAVHVEPEIRPVADVRLARVHPHPDAQVDAARPFVPGESALRCHEGIGSELRLGEHDEELIAALVDDDARAGLDRLAEEPAMVVEDVRVVVTQPLKKLSRPLDVCEDECDGAMWKIRHRSLLQGDLGADSRPGAGRALHVELAAERGYAVGQPAQP